jgi:ketosteroid isomerase-like protein
MSGNYLTVFARQPDGSWKAAEDFATEAAAAGT